MSAESCEGKKYSAIGSFTLTKSFFSCSGVTAALLQCLSLFRQIKGKLRRVQMNALMLPDAAAISCFMMLKKVLLAVFAVLQTAALMRSIGFWKTSKIRMYLLYADIGVKYVFHTFVAPLMIHLGSRNSYRSFTPNTRFLCKQCVIGGRRKALCSNAPCHQVFHA
jgi:hypothetical protein